MIQFETLGVLDLRKDGSPVRAVLVQPRRLALLAYLAVARPRGYHSRDKLLGLFWPDADQERARNSLRQALHQLRKALGDDVLLARGDREIGVDEAALDCDAAAFDRAIEAGRLEEALDRYRGEFLPGFFLDGAPEVERFIEAERERYRRAAVAAAWKLADSDEAAGDARAAAVRARRALALDPDDEPGLRRVLQLLARSGERAAGLRLYDDFARRLEQDLELKPAAETLLLVERLRASDETAPREDLAPVAPPPGEATTIASAAGAGGPPEAAATPAVAVPDAPASSPTGASSATAPAAQASGAANRRRWLPLAAVALVAAVAIAVFAFSRGSAPPGTPTDDVSTIAVLPFANITGDPANEYLADGIAEELMAALSRIPGLNVAGHTSAFSFKGKEVPLDSIGRALRVGHVLEGSVRVTGSRVRIVAALVDTRSGFHAWSDSYDGELDDVLSVQDRIARSIVGALRPRFRMEAGGDGSLETVDAQAHADVLRGQQALRAGSPSDYVTARTYFSRALARDSSYAEAHAGLAGVQMAEALRGVVPRDEGFAAAVASAERALALDPTLAEAYGVLGRVAQDYRWDFAAADRYFQRAIELSPGSEIWYRQRARLLAVLGRHGEAIALARRSTVLDPLAPGAYRYLGLMQYHAGLYEAALGSFERALALAPNHPYGLSSASHVLSAAGRHPEAVAATTRALEVAPDDPIVLSAAGVARAAAGDTAEARRLVDRLLALPRPSFYLAAEVFAQLGDRDRMFALLDRAAAERDPVLSEVGAMRIFDPYRDDPRMRRLRQRVGLP